MAWQCFDVATWYFEEILLDLKNKQAKNNDKKRNELIKSIECSDVPVEGE